MFTQIKIYNQHSFNNNSPMDGSTLEVHLINRSVRLTYWLYGHTIVKYIDFSNLYSKHCLVNSLLQIHTKIQFDCTSFFSCVLYYKKNINPIATIHCIFDLWTYLFQYRWKKCVLLGIWTGSVYFKTVI